MYNSTTMCQQCYFTAIKSKCMGVTVFQQRNICSSAPRYCSLTMTSFTTQNGNGKNYFKKTVNLRHRKSIPISRMLTNHRQTLLIFLVLMNNSCLILIDYFILSIWTYITIDHDNDNDLVYILHLTSFLIEH